MPRRSRAPRARCSPASRARWKPAGRIVEAERPRLGGHVDHIGVAERLRVETGARVLVHEADETLVRTGKQPPRERGALRYLWRPPAIRLFMHLSHAGGASITRPGELETFRDRDVLDVPGSPQAIHTPGHSRGHCCLAFAEHRTLFVGDALLPRFVVLGTAAVLVPW